MKNFKRRNPFRASVVVTVAALAPLAGACEETSATQNPPPPECPDAPPADGTDCFGPEGQECGYEPCFDYNTITATCTGGAWTVEQATCNPPPPDAGEGDDAGDDAGN